MSEFTKTRKEPLQERKINGNRKNRKMDDLMAKEPIQDLPLRAETDVLFREFNDDYRYNTIVSAGIDKFFLFSDGKI
jgi:hypothetical protein